jgi:uncharacterized protein YcbX
VTLTLTGLHRYPVKSFRGEALQSALVEPWGLRGDRRWMVVDEDGMVVTARDVPRMLLVVPELVDGGLRLNHPDLDPIEVAVPDGSTLADVQVWSSSLQAAPAGAAADAWVSKVLGAPARLVYLDDPTRRAVNPRFGRSDDRVSFADGYPLLLASEDSLAALNELIAGGRHPQEGPLPMRRFRPSLVVRGAPAWDEDHWRRLRIGDAVFRVVKGCDRCIMTITDPDTAERGKEPLATLARHRRWDGSSWFAMNLIPDTPGVSISVGDSVEVLEREETDGPPR